MYRRYHVVREDVIIKPSTVREGGKRILSVQKRKINHDPFSSGGQFPRVHFFILKSSQCHCYPLRHRGKPDRLLGEDRPLPRTLRWQCDRRGIDQASGQNGLVATGFFRPFLLQTKSIHITSSFFKDQPISGSIFHVQVSIHSPRTSMVPTSSSLRRQISIVHNEPETRPKIRITSMHSDSIFNGSFTCTTNTGRTMDDNRRTERMARPRITHRRNQAVLHITHPLQELQHCRSRKRHSVVWPRRELHVRHRSCFSRLNSCG